MTSELICNKSIRCSETSSNIYHPVVREDEHVSLFSDPLLPPSGAKQRQCFNKEYTFGLGCGPHNIIQIHDNVLWDWHYFMEHFSYAVWMWRTFCIMLVVSKKKKKKLWSPVGDRREWSVCSFHPRPMSMGHRNRSKELLPPFESRHYSHK